MSNTPTSCRHCQRPFSDAVRRTGFNLCHECEPIVFQQIYEEDLARWDDEVMYGTIDPGPPPEYGIFF